MSDTVHRSVVGPYVICPTTGKRGFRSHAKAVKASKRVKRRVRVYLCEFCGCWHLTTHAARRRQAA